jgi:hypothetical protein
MLEHRLQILLDDDRYQKVVSEARRRGVSIAAVIREALDRLPSHVEARRSAIDAILDADTMAVPKDPADLRREVDAAHERVHR